VVGGENDDGVAAVEGFAAIERIHHLPDLVVYVDLQPVVVVQEREPSVGVPWRAHLGIVFVLVPVLQRRFAVGGRSAVLEVLGGVG
jgi:hypothetical protein